MFQNLKTRTYRHSNYRDIPNAGTFPSMGISPSPGVSSFQVKGNEYSRLVRCRICGFPCDKERDSRAPDNSWAGIGVTYSLSTYNTGLPVTMEDLTPVTDENGNQVYTDHGPSSIGDVDHLPYTADLAVSFRGHNNTSSTNSTALICSASSAINIYSSIANAPFTFEAWVFCRDNGQAALGTIAHKGHNSPPNINVGYQFHVFSGDSSYVKLGANVRHGDGTDGQQATAADLGTGNGSLPRNQWAHAAFVYNSAGDKTIQIYVNGVPCVQATTQAGTGNVRDDSAQDLYIGNKNNGSVTFNGMIKDIKIYHGVALTDYQLLSSMNNTPVVTPSAFWDMDNFGLTTVDSIGGLVLTGSRLSSNLTSVSSYLEFLQVSPKGEKEIDIIYERNVVGGCPACGCYTYDQ